MSCTAQGHEHSRICECLDAMAIPLVPKKGVGALPIVHQHRIPDVNTLQHQKEGAAKQTPEDRHGGQLSRGVAEGKHEVLHDGPVVEEHDSYPTPGEPNHGACHLHDGGAAIA